VGEGILRLGGCRVLAVEVHALVSGDRRRWVRVERVPGAKARLVVLVRVRAEARTYLRGNG
jgi:hypothetical protein